ncbi:N-formylglutamate amidohydrolase [Algihabitans albus]|uniref:N-formylglutamate amidohydrolase n=1 Tax=Algihabitans albus TaxID=2164067 RepID=UPI000E5D3F10|nr:N-formylglutamate amidohydrolase [Algihabitans albus]
MPADPADLVELLPARGEPVPLLLDSPHSGSFYPDDFDYACSLVELRRAEDMYVDELFATAPARGAPLLRARFPRSYIDPNRSLEDIDPDMIAGGWPQAIRPGEKTRLGVGLIWSRLQGKTPIYRRKLGVEEVRQRIERCWRPYHATLEREVERLHAAFGCLFHLDCHSMPANGDPRIDGNSDPRADFVLGDREGTACCEAFTARVEAYLKGLGYDVRRNQPYKGVELVRRYSDPAAGRHSLQLEINRRLYMNEDSFEKTAHFTTLQADLDGLLADLAVFAAEESRVVAGA